MGQRMCIYRYMLKIYEEVSLNSIYSSRVNRMTTENEDFRNLQEKPKNVRQITYL